MENMAHPRSVLPAVTFSNDLNQIYSQYLYYTISMSYLGEFFRCSQRSVSSRGKTRRYVNDSFTSSVFLLRDMWYAHLDLLQFGWASPKV